MFSVIIPTYNREKELPRALLSIVQQSYKNFEVVIVDNGSTDDTKNVINGFINDYPEIDIQYIYQKNSGSPAGSRNSGIKAAKYDWVAFLDSDDTWEDNKLEKIAQVIDQDQDGFVAVGHWEYQKCGDIVSIAKLGQLTVNQQYEDLLFNGNRYSTSAMVVQRQALKQVKYFDERESYFGVEDYKMWLDLSRVGLIKSINEPLSTFYQELSSFSGNVSLHSRNLKALVVNEIQENYQANHWLLRKHSSRIDYYHGRELQKRGMKSASKILLFSILAYPFSIKKYVSLIFSIIGVKR